MSSAEIPSILAAVTAGAVNRGIHPWKWQNEQITAFRCNFVVGHLADLPLSSHTTANSNTSYMALEMLHQTLQWRTAGEHVMRQLCAGIPNDPKSGISTNAFADTPLLLRFGKKRLTMTSDCVIAKFGVPLTALNTAANFHKVSQMLKARKDVESYTGGEFQDETIRAMNMAVIIALAQRQAAAVTLKCIKSRDVFEVAAIYVPEKAHTIDIYTAKVPARYLQDLEHPQRQLSQKFTITKTQIDFPANELGGITDCLRFTMATVSDIEVLKAMENVGEPVTITTYKLD